MPTRERSEFDNSFTSNGDMTAKQFYAVKLHTVADEIIIAGAGNGIGVMQNKPNAGQAAKIMFHGISRNVVDGSGTAIAINDFIKSDSAGKGVKAATADDLAYGIALEAATGSADEISILMTGLIRVHA